MVKITFPDGSEKEFDKGITALEIAKGISEGLSRAVVAAKLDDELIDLTRPIEKDGKLCQVYNLLRVNHLRSAIIRYWF